MRRPSVVYPSLEDCAGKWRKQSFNEGKVQANLGFLHGELDHPELAPQHYERMVEIYRAFDYLYAVGVGLNGLGQIALKVGDLDTAARVLAEALSCFEQTGGMGMVEQVRGNLAVLKGLRARRQRQNVVARQAFEEALSVFEEKAYGPSRDLRPFVRRLFEQLQATPTTGDVRGACYYPIAGRPLLNCLAPSHRDGYSIKAPVVVALGALNDRRSGRRS
jgi:hypothetical protein